MPAVFEARAQIWMPGWPNVRGRGMGMLYWLRFQELEQMEVVWRQVDVYGLTAYELGTLKQTWVSEDDSVRSTQYRYVIMWRQQSYGEWLIAHYMLNRMAEAGVPTVFIP